MIFFSAVFTLFMCPTDRIPRNHILKLQELGVYAERLVRFGVGTVMHWEYEDILRYCRNVERRHNNILPDMAVDAASRKPRILSFY